MKRFLRIAKQYIHQTVAYFVVMILRSGAIYNVANFRLWERHGYHITPIHFYYPIPDTREIDKVKTKKYTLSGIDMRKEFQLLLLEGHFKRFSEEYNKFPINPGNNNAFYLENDAFSGIDPHIFYCMIRHFQPKTIIEVGSGYSTLLGAQACRMNKSTKYICIDPWPREFISAGVPDVDFIRTRVENIELSLFQQLHQGDILFIDSSHVIRTGGDVSFLILEVLPLLEKGVIVHLHDIFLPFDYPKDWIVKQHRFWTEQYLLQAYLIENEHIEVLFASHFITKEHANEIRHIFPNALSVDGGSFWIRKR